MRRLLAAVQFLTVVPASSPGEPGGFVQVLNGNGTVVRARLPLEIFTGTQREVT